MNTLQTKELFVTERAKGKSYASIAKEIKVSKTTLIEWSKELSFQISNLKTIELEALFEEYSISKSHRIQSLSKQLASVRSELDKRDLSKVPTERLFAIAGQLASQIRSEEEPLLFKRELSTVEALARVNITDLWEG